LRFLFYLGDSKKKGETGGITIKGFLTASEDGENKGNEKDIF